MMIICKQGFPSKMISEDIFKYSEALLLFAVFSLLLCHLPLNRFQHFLGEKLNLQLFRDKNPVDGHTHGGAWLETMLLLPLMAGLNSLLWDLEFARGSESLVNT